MTRMRRLAPLTRACAVLSLTMLGGCTVGPAFRRPTVVSPPRYRPAARATSGAVSPPSPAGVARYRQRVELGARQAAPWWTVFRSARLDELIRRALAANHDLAADEAAVAQARQLLTVGAAGRYPEGRGEAPGGRKREGADFLGPDGVAPVRYDAFRREVSYRPD